ncbi:MAG TPA: sugar ABC transporter permease [Bacillota bacterium]|nr:sugar ABC transporter permease [Bacillota bacterium]
MARGYKSDEVSFAYRGLLPIFMLYIVLRCWPILHAFWLSMTDAQLINPVRNFVGLRNYIHLLTRDKDFSIAMTNTLVFAATSTILVLVAAFAIALVMERKKIIGIPFLQTVFFLPVVLSVVPCAIIWKWIYDPQYGILNFVLSNFGVPSIGWLVDKKYSMGSIIAFVVWKWLGYYMLIFWVGLKSIPRQYLEAAEVDGAGEWRVLWNIIMPLLKPILLLSLVMATINGFTIFSEVYVMTVGGQGAPGNAVKVLTYDIYERGFVYYKIGQANAEAVILFLIILVLTIIQVKMIQREELY